MTSRITNLIVPRPTLLLTSSRSTTSDVARAIRRQCDVGELRKLGRGAYLATSEWDAMDHRERHIAMMRAEQERHREPLVFMLDSAAAVLNYPAYGFYDDVVHAYSRCAQQSTPHLHWHHTDLVDDEIVECGGFFITTPERTLWDIARNAPFARAVGMLDAGLRTFRRRDDAVHAPQADRKQLQEYVERHAGKRGAVRASRAIGFARDGADSLGESISRVCEYLQGFPEPMLQVRVSDADGEIGVADQGWPEHNLLGEFDGHEKYTRNKYTNGRAASEIVFKEKVREDRLRATGAGMARWLWADAHHGERLAVILERAGLPREPYPRDDWTGMSR